MILVDPRVGSGELLNLLPGASMAPLVAGDFAVLNPHVSVGVERKRVGDLLRCISDNRFTAEQLPGLLDSYQRVYLLIEGAFACGTNGEFLIRRGGKWEPAPWGRSGGWRYSEVSRWVFSLEESAGVRVHRAAGPRETATWLLNLDAEFQKAPAERTILRGVYEAPLSGFSSPSLMRRFAAILPGVGSSRSRSVAATFPTIASAVMAPAEEWATIDGLGKKTAKRVHEAMWKK